MSISRKPRVDVDDLLGRVDLVALIDRHVPLTKSGAEFEACCPFHAEKSPSFKVSPSKQFYYCFGCGENGNALTFVQKHLGMTFLEAVAWLSGNEAAIVPPASAPAPAVRERKESLWRPIFPIPQDCPDPPKAHRYRRFPDQQWIYRDAKGRLLGYITRYTKSDGGKEILPLSWCENVETGNREWRWMALPEPRPLYGLDRLAARPEAKVLVVEGEKCADVGTEHLLDWVTVSWPGGCGAAIGKIDWGPLAGREVVTWADCDAKREPLTTTEKRAGLTGAEIDALQASKPFLPEGKQPGTLAMTAIVAGLKPLGCKLWRVRIPAPGEKPDGWDVADAVAEGLTGAALASWMQDRLERVGIDPTAPGITPEAPPKRARNPRLSLVTPDGEPPPPPIEELAQDEKSAPSGDAPASRAGARGKVRPPKEVNWERYHDLMDNFVLIYSTPTCFDRRTRLVLQVNHLRLAFGSDYVKMWLGSDRRKMILPSQLVFSPGTDCVFPEINLFDGMPIAPKRGDCGPMLELLRHLCAESEESKEGVDGVMQWVLRWIALPLQRLGTKMQTAMVFHGPEGAGKNLFWELVGKIYGRYSTVVGQKQLEGDFNDWASQKMLVIGDEVVTRQELYHHKGDLKKFITGETIQINPKGLPLREEHNRCNVIFLSNEHQPLALGDSDRRYFVVYTPARRHDDLYRRVGKWADAGGIAAFYDYLLHLDLGGFSQYDIPPMTKAKRDLIELGLKPEERFSREWLSGYLPLPLMTCSASQLYRAFRRWCMASGERFPPAQEVFTKSVKKVIDSLEQKVSQAKGERVVLLEYKVIKLDDSINGQRSVRMWKPDGCKPPEGMTEGKWAAGCVNDFEEYLGKYMVILGGGEKP